LLHAGKDKEMAASGNYNRNFKPEKVHFTKPYFTSIRSPSFINPIPGA
jgi:hypothetical protein